MRVEVLGALERRRRWSRDDKARIVEETLLPRAKVIARRNGVAASLVFTWRRQARTAERIVLCFAPVRIAAAIETGEENSKRSSEDDRRMRQLPAARNGLIEIDLGNWRRFGWMHNLTRKRWRGSSTCSNADDCDTGQYAGGP